MPLFKCEKCGCIENTALTNYWQAKWKSDSLLCSECDPEINEWHGRFTKRSAIGMYVDEEGFLWSTKQVEAGYPKHTKIVGKVTKNP